MKLKTAREALKDHKLLNNVDEEADMGCDYNYIVANHFSLQKYIKKHNITFDRAFNIGVMCKVTILNDKLRTHVQKKVREARNIHSSQLFQDELFYKNSKKSLIFKDGTKVTVPLLYLITNAFSLDKELIFETRVCDDRKEHETSPVLKKEKGSLFDDSLLDLINSSVYCKANVFLRPIMNSNATEVEWYIPTGTLEENQRNAKALYLSEMDHPTEDESEDSFEEIFGEEGLSDEEIKKAIRKLVKSKSDAKKPRTRRKPVSKTKKIEEEPSSLED